MSSEPLPPPDDEVYFSAPDSVSSDDDDRVELMWIERNARPFEPTPWHPMRALRCSATTKSGPRAGKRCGREATLGTTVCESHGANLPIVKKAAEERFMQIKLRLVGMTDDAVDGMYDLMHNAQSEAVRLKTYTEVLDRAGLRGGQDLNVTVDTPENAALLIQDKLATLRNRVIEGELAAEAAANAQLELESHVTVDPVDSITPAEENTDG